MIISASRRTDIPAFYSEWLINRIRDGWCVVPNPLNNRQLNRISLKPEEVDAFVFWSKNPLPLMQYLDEIDNRGFRYYFQYTVNDYPGVLEPGLPQINNRIDSFKKLSERLTDLRVIWRYDPIIISNRTPVDFHVEKFSRIAESLKGHTKRVMISFVDHYKKTDFRFNQLQRDGFVFEKNFNKTPEASVLVGRLKEIAFEDNMEIFSCAEEDFQKLGVLPGCCIDSALINRIWSINVNNKKDPSQRALCGCVTSKDIGVNDTCLHGCAYCYATRDYMTAVKRNSEHNPQSAAIWDKNNFPNQSAYKSNLTADY
jgi:hypothetical protein